MAVVWGRVLSTAAWSLPFYCFRHWQAKQTVTHAASEAAFPQPPVWEPVQTGSDVQSSHRHQDVKHCKTDCNTCCKWSCLSAAPCLRASTDGTSKPVTGAMMSALLWSTTALCMHQQQRSSSWGSAMQMNHDPQPHTSQFSRTSANASCPFPQRLTSFSPGKQTRCVCRKIKRQTTII